MITQTKEVPEQLLVKGGIVKQIKGTYCKGYGKSKIHNSLPSGRIIAVTYKNCRELPGKDGDVIYDPYDVKEVLIDFGWMGMDVIPPIFLGVAEGQIVCLVNGEWRT